MIGSIKRGDALKCLNCGKKIVVDGDTFLFDFDAEYIKCPHCGQSYDVQKYIIYSENFTMGLTVRIKGYEGAYDCGYITYGNFIMRLIKEAYGDVCHEMFQRSLFSGKPFTNLDEIEWAKHQNDDLEIWIWHSDCDGKFTPSECRRIYNAIKDLKIPDFYAHNYGDMKQYNMLERWKDMFLYCARHRVNMYFT